ncbi:MAG: glycosyltransferase, partial [Chloroflexota bacterium]
MARFLLTVWPFSGHLHPNVALAHALRDRGHEVAFYTGASAAPIIEGEGFRLFRFDDLDERFVLGMVSSRQGIRGKVRWPPSLQKKWREFLVGTIPAQVRDLEEVFRQWPPDMIVCDPLVWSPGAVLHERAGIPVSVFSYTMACFVPGRDAPLLGVSYPKPRGRLERIRYDAARLLMQAVAKGNVKHLNRVRASYDLPPLKETMPARMSRFPLY